MVSYNRVTWSGRLGAGEIWSVGCSFGGADGTGGVGEFVALEEWVEGLAAAFDNVGFPGTLMNLSGSAMTLTRARVDFIDTAGDIIQSAEAPVTNGFGNGIPVHPNQSAVVASLRTGRPGRSYRGRMYFPAMAVSLAGDGMRVNSPTPLTIASAVAELFDAAEAAEPPASALVPVVHSQSLNVNTPISQILVGNVMDTQRRRRDALAEVYAVQQYPDV